MGLFNIFKKRDKIIFQQIVVTKKANSDIYIGQLVSIDADEGKNGENFYLTAYPDVRISNKITSEYTEYCEKYSYAIIKNFNDKKIDARIICCDGYLMRLKVSFTKQFKNGNAFIIKGDNLYDNNELIGKIVDNRYNESLNIIFNELDNDRLVVFIKK